MLLFVVGLICISSVSAADLSNDTSDVDVLNVNNEPAYENDKMAVVLTATENYGNDDVNGEPLAFADASGNNFTLESSEISSGAELIDGDIFIGGASNEGIGNAIGIDGNSSGSSANHFGYWVWSSDMYDMNFTDLANKGVSDILLNYYAFERYNKTDVEAWVADANEKGIHIHIWALIFYDGKWNRPVSQDGVVNYYYNKQSLKIIKKSTFIAVQNENIINWKKLKNLSKKLQINTPRTFMDMIENKAYWNNTGFIKVPRSFASTQICSKCGEKNKNISGIGKLGIQNWKCTKCGKYHNRDINAAINILNKGLEIVGTTVQ